MGFARVVDLANALDGGKSWTSWFHKTSTPVVTAGYWADMSMGAGTPKYNAWVGNQTEATVLTGSGNNGIYTAGNVSPDTKVVTDITIQSSAATMFPANFVLLDYLMFYTLVDGDSTDLQEMDNTLASLTRYTDGLGVRAMIVCTTPQTATALSTITYTDDTNTERSVTVTLSAVNTGMINCGVNTGVAAAGNQNPFIPLHPSSRGVKNIVSVQNAAGAGGFFTICLVRPLAEAIIREQNTVHERSTLLFNATVPPVQDGAYLNFIYQASQGAASSVVRGSVTFAWG